MPLSSLAVQNAKPRENVYVLTDGNSLHLLVNPNGSKLWRLRYRFSGKQNMLSLGSVGVRKAVGIRWRDLR
jgi:Arm DNA-binding domain